MIPGLYVFMHLAFWQENSIFSLIKRWPSKLAWMVAEHIRGQVEEILINT